MKCRQCGFEWIENSSIHKIDACPVCGGSIEKEERKSNSLFEWYRRAADNGNVDAKDMLKRLGEICIVQSNML